MEDILEIFKQSEFINNHDAVTINEKINYTKMLEILQLPTLAQTEAPAEFSKITKDFEIKEQEKKKLKQKKEPTEFSKITKNFEIKKQKKKKKKSNKNKESEIIEKKYSMLD